MVRKRLLIFIILFVAFLLLYTCQIKNNKYYYNQFMTFINATIVQENKHTNYRYYSWIDYNDYIKYKNTSFYIFKESKELLEFLFLFDKIQIITSDEKYNKVIFVGKGKYGFKYGFKGYYEMLIDKNKIKINYYIPKYIVKQQNDKWVFTIKDHHNFVIDYIVIKIDDEYHLIEKKNDLFLVPFKMMLDYNKIKIIAIGIKNEI